MTDAATIARGLTERDRRLLLSLPSKGRGNPPEGHWVLWDWRLANCQITGNDEASRWTITLKPLGRAVRAILATKETEHE